MDLVMDDTSKNALYGGHAYSPYATNRPHSNGNECKYFEMMAYSVDVLYIIGNYMRRYACRIHHPCSFGFMRTFGRVAVADDLL